MVQESEAGIVYLVNREMLKPRGPYKIVVHEGGTRSGKTYNTMKYLKDCAKLENGLEITVASRDLPHLRRGAMKDFRDIMENDEDWNEQNWSEKHIAYKFKNGSTIEFMGADDIGKVSGPSRDILFCNEVNFFKYIVYRQLQIRTRRAVILDYNPIHPKHWLYDKVLTRHDCYLFNTTYHDNKFLTQEQVDEIEILRDTDPHWARVYADGLRGTLQQGQIYKDWTPISLAEFKRVNKPEVYGVDWGYYPDPTAIAGVKFEKGARYVRKLVYENNLSDEELVKRLKGYGCNDDSIFVAPSDSGGAKAIQYFRLHGFPLTYSAIRGPGSLDNGIKQLRKKMVFYVPDKDLDFEYANYTYLINSNEEITNVPIDKYNHLLDAVRYVELFKPYL